MINHSIQLKKTIVAGRRAIAAVIAGSLISANFGVKPTLAQTNAYCQFSAAAMQEKESLRQSALKGDRDAQNRYQELLDRHAQQLQQCRSKTWPQNQSIWLRLYPCDLQPGMLDKIMDRIVDRGYNKVYIEVFADGQVLLPAAANATAWPSVIRTPGTERVDLLAQAIQKGHQRGLKVYAWMFMMNFGYSYGQRSDRQSVLARNGKGETSLYFVDNESQVFIDPYNIQAKRDYYKLVNEVVRRRPDGVLFDYVRYPRGLGANSVITKVQDLWIYGDAARQALLKRANNSKGLDLIARYARKGSISVADVSAVDSQYPQESEPMWQGRTLPTPTPSPTLVDAQSPSSKSTSVPVLSAAQKQPRLQWELWQLSVAHAIQGVLDFLAVAAWPVQRQGIKAGAVFFPDANQTIGQGYDSRLQPWHRFPPSLEWHAMSYANCGNTKCITALVQRVVQQAPANVQIVPAIAGVWGKTISNRPSLEAQMQAIRQTTPQINSVSHFAFSWQEPQLDSERKSCRNRLL